MLPALSTELKFLPETSGLFQSRCFVGAQTRIKENKKKMVEPKRDFVASESYLSFFFLFSTRKLEVWIPLTPLTLWWWQMGVEREI